MTEPTGDDTRARIRDAAMRQFAEHGFKGATVRGIAAAAGVSPGLVQHHFPSKQALRDACDAFTFRYLREAMTTVAATGEPIDARFVADAHETSVTITRYAAMALAADSPEARRYFDAYAEFTYETLTSGALGPTLPEGESTRDIAVVHTAMHLGQAMFFAQILRALDLAAGDPRTATRIGRAQLFLASDRILGPELRDRISAGLDHYEQGIRTEEDQLR